MPAAKPRYRQLAEQYRKAIANGRYQPGDALPTEMEICEKHRVSRHTARDALRILTDDGLIERRRGAGTVVCAPRAPAFAQPLSDFDSILQYARDAHFEISTSQDADQETLDRLGLTGRYLQLIGFRQVAEQPPQAITAVYIRADVAPDPTTIAALPGSVSEWIEANHPVSIERVAQRMEAVALNKSQAERLDVETASPALRVVRRYRDGNGEIILLSESLHPAGRFAYEMWLDRTRA
ncbi:MAG: GntR family transcriptional regulator [Henriciella sp.]|nr:GntR family transcriptional regulator [Henriciella sp.]